MIEPTGVAADAATILFNLPDYRLISTAEISGRGQVIVETDQLPGCPSCGVITSRRKRAPPSTAPGYSCCRAFGGVVVQIPLVLRRVSV